MRAVPAVLLCFLVVALSGCATFVKKNPHTSEILPKIKTIAVLPADITVFRFTSGGVREEIDDWNIKAKAYARESLQKYLHSQYGYQVKFIEEDWLKRNHKALWMSNRALFYSIALSALPHAFPGAHQFDSKLNNFDYTLGPDVSALAQACDADSLLFIYGYDHEATAGRIALWWWDFSLSLLTGVTMLPNNPSAMTMGLVDAKTGDVLIFKITPGQSEYSFINKNQMDGLIKWFVKDFQIKK